MEIDKRSNDRKTEITNDNDKKQRSSPKLDKRKETDVKVMKLKADRMDRQASRY